MICSPEAHVFKHVVPLEAMFGKFGDLGRQSLARGNRLLWRDLEVRLQCASSYVLCEGGCSVIIQSPPAPAAMPSSL